MSGTAAVGPVVRLQRHKPVAATRRRWSDLFADYDARIEVVYIEPPLPVILDRNRRRQHPVPEKVIRGLADQCEPPTWTEAHVLTIVCDGADNRPKSEVRAART